MESAHTTPRVFKLTHFTTLTTTRRKVTALVALVLPCVLVLACVLALAIARRGVRGLAQALALGPGRVLALALALVGPRRVLALALVLGAFKNYI